MLVTAPDAPELDGPELDAPELDAEARQRLPPPLRDDTFRLYRAGIYDDPAVSVYVNAARDFAVLHPLPSVDYQRYQPRHQKLGLSHYKKQQAVLEARYHKVGEHFRDAASVLEFGAADGAFLALLKERHPGVVLAAVEPDLATQVQRAAVVGDRDFPSVKAARDAGLRVDVVCLFHVFEHFADPGAWLEEVKPLLAPGGRIVLEVPSLSDPLLQLYASAPYGAFYFQRQHPYVYSAASLHRVLTHHGFSCRTQPFQRYGLENHLTWLTEGRPGGSDELRAAFASADTNYRAALESAGHCDTVVAIATLRD